MYPYASININSKYFKLQYNKDYCFITIFKNQNFYIKNKDGKIEGEVNWEKLHPFLLEMDKQVLIKNVVYHTHFGDCKKTRKNNKIYNLKYKNIIKNDTYINKNSKIDTLKNSLNKTL